VAILVFFTLFFRFLLSNLKFVKIAVFFFENQISQMESLRKRAKNMNENVFQSDGNQTFVKLWDGPETDFADSRLYKAG